MSPKIAVEVSLGEAYPPGISAPPLRGSFVESLGTAAAKSSGQTELATAFAAAVKRLGALALHDEVLPAIPTLLTRTLEADRAELWLWDEKSESAYLTHAAGVQATHRRDHSSAGEGVLGDVLENHRAVQNAALTSLEPVNREFAERSGLHYLSAYPLSSNGKVLGVLAVYSAKSASDAHLEWWDTFSQISAAMAQQALAAQQNQKTITQLSLLFEATKLLNSTLDLSELLELILKIARNELDADRGSVFLVNNKRKELWSIVAFGLDHEEIRLPFGRGVAGRVADTGETINAVNAYELEFFEPSFDQKFAYQTKSLLCMPIRHYTGEIVGVIQLLNKHGGGRFTPEDEDFLHKLSGHMAMALENARLHREALEKQRMERELEMARGIQRSLLPDSPPVVPGFDIAVSNEPCFEVGGDYYDFLHLGPQSLLLVIADVEGKGVSSALVMSNLQATLRALVAHLHSLEVLALSLNEMIFNDTKSKKFLSCFIGLLDTRRNGLHYINAGHVPPIHISGSSGQYKLLQEGGTVVGLFPEAEYSRGSSKLEPGDLLVCCTDGVTEACNVQEDEFGTDRLAACVAKHRAKSAQGIVESVLEEVNAFAAGGVHIDDKVLMILKVTSTGMEAGAAGLAKAS